MARLGRREPFRPLINTGGFAVRFPAGGGATGTVAYTNADDTVAANGTTTVTGTVVKTNANDTVVANGSTTVTGSLARTNANDTVVANGTTTVRGTVAKTNVDDTVVASGIVGAITGTVAYTNIDDSVVASGWAGIVTGTVATTNTNDAVAASGTAGSTAQPSGGWYEPQGRKRTKEELEEQREKLGIIPKKVEAVILAVARDEVAQPVLRGSNEVLRAALKEQEIAYKKKYAEIYRIVFMEVLLEMQEQEDEEVLLLMMH